jgi:hypothetical protein
MRGLLIVFACTSLFADERIDRSLAFVDATLELPPPARERPKVKVRIEPAPGRTKSQLKKEAGK